MEISKKNIGRLKTHYIANAVRPIELDNKLYFVKYSVSENTFREIFAKKIFDLVNIKCADYIYCKDVPCLISEDLNINGNFQSAYDLKINSISMVNVERKILELYYQGKIMNYEEIMLQVKVMHFIDILFSNVDRHEENFGFIIDKNKNMTLVVLDNEEILKNFHMAIRPFNIQLSDVNRYVSQTNIEEWVSFFGSLNDFEKECIIKIYKLFNPRSFFKIISEVEKYCGIKLSNKASIFKEYVMNYYEMGTLLKGKGLYLKMFK